MVVTKPRSIGLTNYKTKGVKMLKTFTNMGKLIKQVRDESNLKVDEFIEKCNLEMSHQFLHNIERGNANMPMRKQRRIIKIMEIELIEFQTAALNDFMSNYLREISL